MQKTCNNCHSILDLIPAGVSKKTGKPYNAFYVCPNKCVQQKGAWDFSQDKKDIEEMQQDQSNFTKWPKRQGEGNGTWEAKDRRIAREAALHYVCILHTGHKTPVDMIMEDAEEFVNFIYEKNKEPKNEEIPF